LAARKQGCIVAVVQSQRAPADDVETAALRELDRGDTRLAAQHLMDGYGDAVYRLCRQILRDATLTDDVHQTVFVQAFEALARFDRRSSLRTWIFAIARHRCFDALKSTRRWRRRFVAVDERVDTAASTTTAPDAAHEQAAAQRQLERCMEGLSAESRLAVVLRFQHELSFAEMETVCGARANTLQARVARALVMLRDCLRRRSDDHGR
jgi:RNA polymerase sigma-70 factor (ECF subfamily)